ncbi:glucokinase [Paenibacillus sp. J31TS4]|uniref:ROK family protein n=1 Tax=Paenibacillus sp. J31TS4 TaxID=2807195 RepID=UPI001B137AB1|nr:ROK family protein [Paenibacillus sp. J31TS4]GIP38414.1 glucokinase [Paenibacillus sp. J31TS4]
MNKFVGVDIGGTKMMLVAEHEGEWIEHRTPTGHDRCTLAGLKEELDRFLDRLPYEPDGVGIGLVGLVAGTDRVAFSDMKALDGATAAYFSDGRFPVRLLNDVKAATMAEAAHYPDARTLAVIMAGTGVAMGVVADGKLLGGASGWSGELGYTMFPTDAGTQKLDHLAGGAAILRQAGMDVETFLASLERGDEKAEGIIDRAGYYFGLTLTNVLHLYNPDRIVIGGSAASYKGYLDKALAVAQELTLKEHWAACTIVPARDPRRIVALGAREFARRLAAEPS